MSDTYLGCCMSNFSMKSLAARVTSLNSSASKSNSAVVTLARVSASVSPANGDRPDKLQQVTTTTDWTNHNNNDTTTVTTTTVYSV